MPNDEPGLGLGPKLVHDVFPFHIAFGKELEVVQYGRGVPKVCPNVRSGLPFGELFAIFRPRVDASLEQLHKACGSTFFLDSLTTGIRMRGQLVLDPDTSNLVFLGTPWFTDIADFEKSTLELGDFTVHDPIVDFLYMVQAKALALADAQKFSETIVRQRDELQKINEHLTRASAAKSQFLTVGRLQHDVSDGDLAQFSEDDLRRHRSRLR